MSDEPKQATPEAIEQQRVITERNSKWLIGEGCCSGCGWPVKDHPSDTDCLDALGKALALAKTKTFSNDAPASSLNKRECPSCEVELSLYCSHCQQEFEQ